MRRKLSDLTILLATLLTAMAIVIPSQASAAPLKATKVDASNAYTVASCTFTTVRTNPAAGTMTIRIQAVARARGFNLFKNTYTYLVCYFYDPNQEAPVADPVFEGRAAFNRTVTVTVNATSIRAYCGETYTEQGSGPYAYQGDCVQTGT